MKVLHISDIHFNYKNFESEVLRNRLLRYIDENNIKVDAIIITGDCVYQYGKTEECENFIKDLRMKTGCKKCNVFICPGNHDVDRENKKREKKILEIRETKADITAKVYDDLVANGYDRFCSFYRESTGRKYKDFGVIERNNGDSKFRIISVNTFLLSQDDNDEGKLRVCCNKLESISNEKYNDDCINILIMHHGIEYFQEEEILKFQHWLDDNYIDIVMCGHSHRGGISVLTDTKFEIKQFVCGATMLDNYTIPSFLVYDFNIQESRTNIKLHTFSNDGWAMENSHLRAFKNGEHQYKLCRLHKMKQKNELARSPKIAQIVYNRASSMEKLNIAQIAFFDELDQKVFTHYGKKILSSKYGNLENFSTEKIICSLLNVGMPFEMTLKVVETVVDTLVSLDYRENSFGELTTEQIRNEVYFTICRLSFENDNKIDIYEWAGKYARRYGHNICSSDIMKKTNIQQDNDIVPSIISFSEIALKVYKNYKEKNVTCYGKMDMILPAIFSKGMGFVVKEPLKKQKNCFWVSTNWKREDALPYGLGKQILVVITSNITDDLEKVKRYLSGKTGNCGETIWLQEGGNTFSVKQKELIQSQSKRQIMRSHIN